MPEDSSHQRFLLDWPNLPAIRAVWMIPNYKELFSVRGEAIHTLDHDAVYWMVENNYIPLLQLAKQKGDFEHEHKIPFLVFWRQAVACNPNNLKH